MLTGRVISFEMRPVLLLEINEVPWRLVDLAVRSRRCPSLTAFFDRAATYTSISADEGELSPWITWPSLHRGLNNTEHGIKNLGQDISTFRGTPLWEEYRKRGLSVGVCGSMQSWPATDPGRGGFYIPDTFAHDPCTIPKDIEPLQAMNLDLVNKNGLVSRQLDLLSRKTLRALPALARRVSLKTGARIAVQLTAERFDKTLRARRPIFQTLLFWDVFRSLYENEDAPPLATFFTNHVAGVMHRFWNHVFPEDFSEPNSGEHLATMHFALSVLDEMLAQALRWLDERPDLIIAFASSMGQTAVHREKVGYVASVTDLPRFMRSFGFAEGKYKPLLAMVPQVAVEIASPNARGKLKNDLLAARTPSQQSMFEVDEVASSLSITILTPKGGDATAGGFLDSTGQLIPFSQAGVTLNDFADGTGYHVPEGVLAIVGRGINPTAKRQSIPLSAVKQLLMSIAEIDTLHAANAV